MKREDITPGMKWIIQMKGYKPDQVFTVLAVEKTHRHKEYEIRFESGDIDNLHYYSIVTVRHFLKMVKVGKYIILKTQP